VNSLARVPRVYDWVAAFGSCEEEFSANSDGQIATQVLANANVAGLDGQVSSVSLYVLTSRNLEIEKRLTVDLR
jgi:hypothetical protein